MGTQATAPQSRQDWVHPVPRSCILQGTGCLAVGLWLGAAGAGGSGDRGWPGPRSAFPPGASPESAPSLCAFREDFGGDASQHRSSPITAITELSLRGQPSIKTGPKIRTEGWDSCKERGIWLKRLMGEGRGWSPTPAASHLAVTGEFSQKLSSPTRSLAPSRALAAPNPVSAPSRGGQTGFWGAGGPEADLAVAAVIFSHAQSGQGTLSAAFPFGLILPSLLLFSNKYNSTKIPPAPQKSLH